MNQLFLFWRMVNFGTGEAIGSCDGVVLGSDASRAAAVVWLVNDRYHPETLSPKESLESFGLEDSACLWIHPSYEKVAGTNWGGGLAGRLEMREASCCQACIGSGCSSSLWVMAGGREWWRNLMPLDSHSYLLSQGWGGKGTGLRQGAISRPLAIPQKKTLAGLGKDRDEAFPFWDQWAHTKSLLQWEITVSLPLFLTQSSLFLAASKSIQIKCLSDDEEENENSMVRFLQ